MKEERFANQGQQNNDIDNAIDNAIVFSNNEIPNQVNCNDNLNIYDNQSQNSEKSQIQNTSIENKPKSIIKKHGFKLGLGAFVISGICLLSNPSAMTQTENKIFQDAHYAIEIFPITEGCAWLGAGMMLVSAGRKIGNPLTIKKRLGLIRKDLDDNRLYRAGWALGALGAVGTSATIAVGSVANLPQASWPLAFGVSAASIAFSTIPFKPRKGDSEVQ